MLRNILSIGLCVVAWGVAWVGANAGLSQAFPARFDANGVTTDAALLVVFVGVCVLLCVMAGWMCARLVRGAVMRHVAVLALVQLGIGIVVQVGVWDLMPLWYHLTFLATVVPMHLVGGRLGMAGRSALPLVTPVRADA